MSRSYLKIEFFLILNCLFLIINGQYIEINPTNQYIKPYTDVELACKVSGFNPTQDLIEWCKNDFCTWGRLYGKDSDEILQYKNLPKYFITGDRVNGEWNLLIKNVTEKELGEYKCTFTSKTTQNFKKQQSTSASIELIEKPGLITFENSKPLELILNKSKIFECKVYKGVPPPVFSWKLIDKKGVSKNLEEFLHTTEMINESFIYTSKIKLNSSFEYENANLVCEIEHPMLQKIIRSVDIDFKYAPILTITNNPDNDLIENKTYTFNCNPEAIPKVNTNVIKLVDSNRNVYNHYTSTNGELVIKLKREMNGKVLVCESGNSIDSTVANKTLDISYSPSFVDNSETFITLNNTQKNFQLECNVLSNPPAQIEWFDKNNKLIQIESQLNINIDATLDYTRSYSRIYGRYLCRALSSGYKPIEREIIVVKNGIPSITGKSLYSVEKESNLEIKFSVLSSPHFKDDPLCSKLVIDRDINLRQLFLPININKRYFFKKVYKDSRNFSSEISFVIESIKEVDFGVYNCSVSNSYGSNSFIFEVQAKTSNSNFIIALTTSIIFLVLFLSVVISIIIITLHIKFKKRNLKKNSLKSGYDFSTSIKNSPNLSVSEWITNNSLAEKKGEKSFQNDVFFDGKTINTFADSNVNMDSILIYPSRHSNQSSVNSENQLIDVRNETNLEDNLQRSFGNNNQDHGFMSQDLNKLYQDVSVFSVSNYQSPSVILSKFQTNV